MESLYSSILSVVLNQINGKKGQSYFPFIFALFLFIAINNLIGLVPYSFATTSHFALTFSLSFTIVLGATIIGFSEHGLKFFSLLVPAGCPLSLLPLLHAPREVPLYFKIKSDLSCIFDRVMEFLHVSYYNIDTCSQHSRHSKLIILNGWVAECQSKLILGQLQEEFMN